MKSIRPQTVTLLVLAILFGLAAALVFKSFLIRQPVAIVVPPPQPPDTIGMLVWQANLPVNSRIRDSDVAIVQEPRSMNKVGMTLHFIPEVRGRVCKAPMFVGNVVTLKDFYDMAKEKPPTWADILPHGLQLCSLRIDDPSFSPAMLTPNCYIDVSLTVDRPDNDVRTTTRLVHGLQVMSSPVTDGGVPDIVTTARDGKVSIKVAATPAEAATLTTAQQSGGQISVALCDGPPGEHDVAVNDVDLGKLLHIPTPAPPIVPEVPAPISVAEYHGQQVVYKLYDGTSGDPIDQVDAEKAAYNDRLAAAKAAAGGTPAPPPAKKRCKSCEEAAKKKELERQRRLNGNVVPVPTPDSVPGTGPTPAPTEPLPPPSGPQPTPAGP